MMNSIMHITLLPMAFLLHTTVAFGAQAEQWQPTFVLGSRATPGVTSHCINCENWAVFYDVQASSLRAILTDLVNTRAALEREKAIVADLRGQPDIQQMTQQITQQAAQVAAGELAAARAQIGNLTASSVGLFRRLRAEQAIVASERATVANLRAQLDAAVAENARMDGCVAQQHTEIEVLRQQCALWCDQNAAAQAEIMYLRTRLLAIEAIQCKGIRRQ